MTDPHRKATELMETPSNGTMMGEIRRLAREGAADRLMEIPHSTATDTARMYASLHRMTDAETLEDGVAPLRERRIPEPIVRDWAERGLLYDHPAREAALEGYPDVGEAIAAGDARTYTLMETRYETIGKAMEPGTT